MDPTNVFGGVAVTDTLYFYCLNTDTATFHTADTDTGYRSVHQRLAWSRVHAPAHITTTHVTLQL